MFSTAFANGNKSLSDTDQAAVGNTIDALNNKKLREEYIKNNKAAQGAHENAKDLAGNEQNLDRMYEIVGQVMRQMANDTGGDAEKMKKILELAKENPAHFYETLNKDNRDLIRKLANDIDAIKPGTSSDPK